jgi:hypothetical protein
MSDIKHITKTEFIEFQHDTMKPKDKEGFLGHICSCDYCSEQFASLMSEEMITAPKDMKENILKATKRPEIQLAVRMKETSNRMQFFIYSLKVGTATVVALFLLMLSVNFTDFTTTSSTPSDGSPEFLEEDTDYFSLPAAIRDNMNTLSSNMLDFSNNIMKTEVTDNDQKEE